MKKIIVKLSPFLLNQEFIVTEDGNRLDVTKGKMKEIPEIIFKLAEQYDVQNVNLIGAKKYAEGIEKQIKKAELVKYEKNKLDIKII